MPDYSRYKTETLERMQDKAFADYYKEAVRPCGDGRDFDKSPAAKRLKRVTDRYMAICAELEKRMAIADDKCVSCVHNIGDIVMNCEYACTGVEEIADEGRIVVSCSDYSPKSNTKNGRNTVK